MKCNSPCPALPCPALPCLCHCAFSETRPQFAREIFIKLAFTTSSILETLRDTHASSVLDCAAAAATWLSEATPLSPKPTGLEGELHHGTKKWLMTRHRVCCASTGSVAVLPLRVRLALRSQRGNVDWCVQQTRFNQYTTAQKQRESPQVSQIHKPRSSL